MTSLPAPIVRTEILPALPVAIQAHGEPGRFAYEEFFLGMVRCENTRVAYERAVKQFLEWVRPQCRSLAEIEPRMVGKYLSQPGFAPSTKKLRLAALRAFFDWMVTRHVIVLNPAATVRGERYEVVEGLTPEISPVQARKLLDSVKAVTLKDKRDKAVLGCLIFTAARAGAIAKLQLSHLIHDGTQYLLQFTEKGGKVRKIPVRHDLQGFILDYIQSAGLTGAPKDSPLFRSVHGKVGTLNSGPMTSIAIWRMMKRRLRAAGLPDHFSPHSFRVATVTNLLNQGVSLEDVQYLAGHADPRTTRLYDRRQKTVTRNTVEKISI